MTSTHESVSMTQQQTVSQLVAATIPEYTTQVFTLMGNGNAYFLDALTANKAVTMTALRHEAGTVASADSYYRISRKIACASTTYGPGFTNALTPLAEAVCSRSPMVVVVGAEPTTGPRPWDVDQTALAQAVGAISMTMDPTNPVATTRQAFETATANCLPVVLSIPYDIATTAVTTPPADTPVADKQDVDLPTPNTDKIGILATALQDAQRPLILAGRGARDAAAQLGQLADTLGALTVSTAPARGTFANRPWDLGVCGGFASQASSELIKQADVVLAIGASLNQFTTAFGHQFNADARLIQIDVEDSATTPQVTTYLQADATQAVTALIDELPEGVPPATRWQGTAEHAKDSTLNFNRDQGTGTAPDGLLDPRTAMVQLNDILPVNRQVISDGGHFIGWSSYYFDLPAPDSLVMVGTHFQSIGLGLPSAVGAAVARPEAIHIIVTGDGGAIMGLADLDSIIRTSNSAAVIVFNDGCYGAEIHQYGSQGLDTGIMEIQQADFVKHGEGFGATGVVINTIEDLQHVHRWVDDGAKGTIIIDLRISRKIVAPYIEEIVEVTLKK